MLRRPAWVVAFLKEMYREGVTPNVAELLMDPEEEPIVRDLVQEADTRIWP